METLVVQGNTKSEMKLFKSLAHRLGLKAKFMSASEMEDLSLANAMETGRTGEFVDLKEFLENLEKK